MRPKLHIVVASTRPGRIGPAIAQWVLQAAEADGKFEPVLVDLADFALPVYDEPHHPRLKKYEHEHTRAWSASVEAADAFVFVVPEYNYGPTPALVNALNYVYHEWNYKPAAFVSYGGVSGGMRAVQETKTTLLALKMAPINEGVVMPMVFAQLKDGAFEPTPIQTESATVMFNELARWTEAMKVLRA